MEIKNSSENQKDTKTNSISIGQRQTHEAVFMGLTKKAEKISIGLYLVTDLIDPNDPIRNRIREGSMDLIKDTRAMTYAFSGDVYFMVARAISKSWEIVSLVDVASSVGFISDMNARILRGVLVEFIGALRDKQRREGFSNIEDLKIGESLASEISLTKELFEVKELTSKGQEIKDTNTSVKMSFKKEPVKTETPKNTEEKTGNFVEPIVIKNKEEGPKKSDRREKIIEIIKEKKEVMIGDVTASFPDVSSKTIQRELTSLVEEGVLNKEGEKRWSKYFINLF
jgi:hypothetical protein